MANGNAQSALGRMAGAARPRLSAGWLGGVLLILIAVPCFVTMPWSTQYYTQDFSAQMDELPPRSPSVVEPMGSDALGRSLLWRCLLGGAISLTIGMSAALLSVFIGVIWGSLAGYAGGRVDSAMMRVVDVLYGLPYILLVVLIDLALQPTLRAGVDVFLAARVADRVADVTTLLMAIAAASWLTMARVIRGQVLSLREHQFIEAARSIGAGPWRILRRHLLPNLIGPIVVYTTLTVPQAILQESFLSFLGIGVHPPLPSWGNLATNGVEQLPALAGGGASFNWEPGLWTQPLELLSRVAGYLAEAWQHFVTGLGRMDWWLLAYPCLLLGLTLMALNFLGDALRDRFDPKS
jgi:oligopeptide transport system permease protein